VDGGDSIAVEVSGDPQQSVVCRHYVWDMTSYLCRMETLEHTGHCSILKAGVWPTLNNLGRRHAFDKATSVSYLT